MSYKARADSHWRGKIHEIIFEADTPQGKAFDVFLIFSILISVFVIMLESVKPINAQYFYILFIIDWFFTFLFTIEYILRLFSVRRPLLYAKSFYGLVDLFAILPSYIGLLLPGTGYLQVIRIVRVLRIFRVFKLVHYVREAQTLGRAMRASRSLRRTLLPLLA